jgi:hypothetical protein
LRDAEALRAGHVALANTSRRRHLRARRTSSNGGDTVDVARGVWSPREVTEPPAAGRAAAALLAADGPLAAAALAAPILATIAVGTAHLGAPLRPSVLVLWGVGAVAARAFPAQRTAVAVLAGGFTLAIVDPLFSLYYAAVLAALTASRTRLAPFAVVLVAAAIVFPKLSFSRHFNDPAAWSWFRQPSLALALFASAAWFRARADRTPAGVAADRARAGAPADEDGASLLLLYLLPSQATHPMVFGPKLLARQPRVDAPAIVSQAFWFGVKVAALSALRGLGPPFVLHALGGRDAAALAWPSLWGAVLAGYVETYLALATYADIPVLVARLYGFDLGAPFRAPLLAWNPVELWRRWGVYTRRFLLDLVYIPLGGSKRHKYRNVALTFLASALVLHSGWLGSIYWQVGVAGWRDQTIYFGLQGLAVSAFMAYGDITGRAGDGAVRAPAPAPVDGWWPFGAWSWQRTAGLLATQAWSALAHVIVLAQGMDLRDRAHLIARCLGL